MAIHSSYGAGRSLASGPVARLGETRDVDLSAANLSGLGIDHIATYSFTDASTYSVENIFSESYADYEIFFKATFSTSSQSIWMRLRDAGIDASGATDYSYQGVYAQANGGTGNGGNSGGTSQWYIGYTGDTPRKSSTKLTMVDPAVASQTYFFGTRIHTNPTGTNRQMTWTGGHHIQNLAYTGFTVYPQTGTMTGTLRIFGYHD